ncbi:hypothetical protein [Curtobacterium sp. 24E2]
MHRAGRWERSRTAPILGARGLGYQALDQRSGALDDIWNRSNDSHVILIVDVQAGAGAALLPEVANDPDVRLRELILRLLPEEQVAGIRKTLVPRDEASGPQELGERLICPGGRSVLAQERLIEIRDRYVQRVSVPLALALVVLELPPLFMPELARLVADAKVAVPFFTS